MSQHPTRHAAPQFPTETFLERTDPSAQLRRLCAGVTRYVDEGLPPGSFVRAVLANHLADAAACADEMSWALCGRVVEFVQEVVPASARGSYAAVDEYLARREREMKQAEGGAP